MSLKKNPKKLLLFLLLLSCILGGIFFMKNASIFQKKQSPNQLAEQILQQCKTAKYRQGCYEKYVPQLMEAPYSLSMKQVYKVVDFIQVQDPSNGYCHNLAHKISENEIQKNPAQWKKIITECPTEGCSNGCIHGAIMAKFHTDRFTDIQVQKLGDEVRTLCEKNDIWQPTKSQTNACFHALGHAAMYITNADIGKSLAFCRQIGERGHTNYNYYLSCYQGAFMQIFQPFEAEDELLVKKYDVNKNNVISYCSQYNRFSKTACLIQTWRYFSDEFETVKGTEDFCKHFDDSSKQFCYTTVINTLTSTKKMNDDFMLKYCSQLSSLDPGICLGQYGTRMMEFTLENVNRAISICEKGAKIDPKGLCYNKIIGTSFLLYNEKNRKTSFCTMLPLQWQNLCKN